MIQAKQIVMYLTKETLVFTCMKNRSEEVTGQCSKLIQPEYQCFRGEEGENEWRGRPKFRLNKQECLHS